MTKKSIVFLILFFIIIVVGLSLNLMRGDEDTWICQNGQWVKHGQPASAMPNESCPANLDNQKAGLANPASANCEAKDGQLEIKTNEDGQIGLCVFNDGSKCEEWSYFRNECQIGNKIVVYSPNRNQDIAMPLKVIGQARGSWFFEASFPVKLLDENNQVIAQTQATAKGEWMTNDFVEFEAVLPGTILSQSGSIPITLVLEKDNPSGLPENEEKITIPLILKQPETTKINLYFGNSKLDPNVSDCTKVFPVSRDITKTEAIGQAAIEELLKGPTSEEKDQGYFTSINNGVEIKSLNIASGVARIDFNQKLQENVGGSCRVTAISSQIKETLKQFPTVKEVIISIDGEIEDILQP